MSDFTGIINSTFKTLFNDAIDALLESTALTRPCQLIFGDASAIECPNCYFDVVSQRSNGIYKSGGSIPFYQGVCPYCFGVGKIYTDSTSTISMAVLWNYKDWVGWNGTNEGTKNPYGWVQTISKFSTITDIKRANKVIINTDISSSVKHVFERRSEPNPAGFGADDYLFTMWERIE